MNMHMCAFESEKLVNVLLHTLQQLCGHSRVDMLVCVQSATM